MFRLSLLALSVCVLAACHCPCEDTDNLYMGTMRMAPVDKAQVRPQAHAALPLHWSTTASGAATVASPEVIPTGTTPKGDLAYCGPFSNETVSVSTSLPEHDFVEISADLLIFASWDGSVPTEVAGGPGATGPDFIRIAIDNGPILAEATFSNLADPAFTVDDSKFQNYPSQVPGDRYPAMTGAAKNTLGILYHRLSDDKDYEMNARYPIHFIVPHKAEKITLQFVASNLQEPDDESWALANVEIRVAPGRNGGVGMEEPPVWSNWLGSSFDVAADVKPENAGKASEAFQTLISGMDHTVAWIDRNIAPKPISSVFAREQLAIVVGADADRAEVAEQKLFDLGPQVEPLLRDGLKTAMGEGKKRLSWLLEVIADTAIEDRPLRRVLLATRVLEIIGTPEAMALRTKLTQN